MGILNSKERIFDFIITKEGKRQLINGNFKVEFASFSDSCVFYQSDETSGSADPTDRISFEASNLPQDQITFEADDSGKLLPFGGSNLSVLGGKILSGSEHRFLEFVTGTAEFASTADKLLSASFDNFKKLSSIGTLDFLDETNNFSLSEQKIKFSVTKDTPIREGEIKEIFIKSTPNLFQDLKMSQVPNFKYLPPRNKKLFKNIEPALLGNYSDFGKGEIFNFEQIKKRISGKENQLIEFTETSNQNNIHMQIFEELSNELLKLDIINFGEIFVDGDDFPNKSVYFVGKVFVDENDQKSFINLFTIILE